MYIVRFQSSLYMANNIVGQVRYTETHLRIFSLVEKILSILPFPLSFSLSRTYFSVSIFHLILEIVVHTYNNFIIKIRSSRADQQITHIVTLNLSLRFPGLFISFSFRPLETFFLLRLAFD